MKAVSLQSPHNIQVIDIPEPPAPKSNEERVKVLYVGVCGSDLAAYLGSSPNVKYPVILGHEMVGELSDGSIVVAYPYTNCLDRKAAVPCFSCNNGHTNSCKFNQTFGVQRDGLMVEYINLPRDILIDVTGIMGNYYAAALVEPLAIGYHTASAAINAYRLLPTHAPSVLVIGCGAVGIGCIDYLTTYRIPATVLDHNVYKTDSAHDLFDVTVYNKSLSSTSYDIVIDAAGSQEVYDIAMSKVQRLGCIASVGYSAGAITVDMNEVVRKELTLIGTRNASKHNFLDVIDNMCKYSYDRLVTGISQLADVPATFENLVSGKHSIREVIHIS